MSAGVGFILLYFLTALWQWLLVWGFIISLGFNTGLGMPLTTAMVNWFVKRRGTALGLSKLFMGFGGMVLPPVLTYLIIQYGWRMTYLTVGILILSVSIPLVVFFVRPRRPEYYGLMPDGALIPNKEKDTASMIRMGQQYAAEIDEVEFTVRQAMKTKAFWVFIAANMLRAMVFPSVSVHGIPHMIGLGVDPMAAATIMGLVFGVGAPIRMLGGVLVDRCPTRRLKYLWILSFMLQALGLFAFIHAVTISMIYVFAVLWGIGFGLAHPISSPMFGRYFGRKGYGTITGTMAMIGLPASIIAPIYIGWIYDLTGSYVSAYTQALVLLVIAIIILFMFLSPPKEKPKATQDITKFV
jgi:MFS family permease